MGLVLSRFKTKSTIEILEQIDKEIYDLNETKDFNVLKFKKYYFKLLFFATIIMLVGIFVLYFLNLKMEMKLYGYSLLGSIPLIVWILKSLLKIYFENYKSSADVRVKELLSKKNTILDNIKETETYKNASEILKRFDKLKLKQIDVTPKVQNISDSPVLNCKTVQTPRPIFPPVLVKTQNRDIGYLDKILDKFLGDGTPDYRFALICEKCHCHNGMALKEEFEYLAFRCAYCKHFNASRKTKPVAPSLDYVSSFHDTALALKDAEPHTPETNKSSASSMAKDKDS